MGADPAATLSFTLLATMVTPAVLLSAAGLLLLSTTTRLARIVDRARQLADQIERLGEVPDPFAAERRGELEAQLEIRARRSHLVQSAVTALYVAVGLLVATMLGIGIAVFAPRLAWLPGGLGVAGTLALFAGCVQLIRETRMALGAVDREMAFALRIAELRRQGGGAASARRGP